MPSCSLGGERLVYNVFENFGGLCSILYLASLHKKGCVMDIGRGKLGGTPTRRFGKVRAVFDTDLGYSTIGNTNGRGDVVARITRFEHLDDEIDFSSRKSFHGSGQEVVVVCLAKNQLFR